MEDEVDGEAVVHASDAARRAPAKHTDSMAAGVEEEAALDAFRRAPSPVLTDELRQLLAEVARTGRLRSDWPSLKPLVAFMLRTALAGYPPGGVAAAAAAADGAGRAPSAGTAPAAAGCASFGDASSPVDAQFYVDALDAFPTAPPFTVQRLCELLLDPLSYYRTQSALAHALDTLLRVTSVAEAAPPLPAAREARRRPRAPAASDSDVLIEERRRPASQGGMDGDGGGAAMSP